jgi:hypothetical protein
MKACKGSWAEEVELRLSIGDEGWNGIEIYEYNND